MESKIIKSDFNGLNSFVKALGDKSVVRVGIFGGKTSRTEAGGFNKRLGHRTKGSTESAVTNAELGAIHEFGSFSKRIPARSFLVMPIMQKAGEIIKQITKAVTFTLVKGDKKQILTFIGLACEEAIQKAFASAGFGLWAPDKPATIRAKGSSAPLIDTAQLRRSIASKVVSIT